MVVVAAAADQRVGPGSAAQHVVAVAPGQGVGARPAEQAERDAAARGARDRVPGKPAGHALDAGDIVPFAGLAVVTSARAEGHDHRFGAVRVGDAVESRATAHDVRGDARVERVVTGAAVDGGVEVVPPGVAVLAVAEGDRDAGDACGAHHRGAGPPGSRGRGRAASRPGSRTRTPLAPTGSIRTALVSPAAARTESAPCRTGAPPSTPGRRREARRARAWRGGGGGSCRPDGPTRPGPARLRSGPAPAAARRGRKSACGRISAGRRRQVSTPNAVPRHVQRDGLGQDVGGDNDMGDVADRALAEQGPGLREASTPPVLEDRALGDKVNWPRTVRPVEDRPRTRRARSKATASARSDAGVHRTTPAAAPPDGADQRLPRYRADRASAIAAPRSSSPGATHGAISFFSKTKAIGTSGLAAPVDVDGFDLDARLAPPGAAQPQLRARQASLDSQHLRARDANQHQAADTRRSTTLSPSRRSPVRRRAAAGERRVDTSPFRSTSSDEHHRPTPSAPAARSVRTPAAAHGAYGDPDLGRVEENRRIRCPASATASRSPVGSERATPRLRPRR